MAKNLAYAECPNIKFHYRNSSNEEFLVPSLFRYEIWKLVKTPFLIAGQSCRQVWNPGTSDALSMSHLSQQPSDPAYYIEDCMIFECATWNSNLESYLIHTYFRLQTIDSQALNKTHNSTSDSSLKISQFCFTSQGAIRRKKTDVLGLKRL